MEDQLADREHGAVDEEAAGDPVVGAGRKVADRSDVGSEGSDVLPAVDGRADAAVELEEFGFGLGFGDQRGEEPDNRRGGGGDQGGFRENDGTVAGELDAGERHGDDERGDHRGDFAPGVDAPPVPAEEKDRTRAGAHAEEELPGGLDAGDVGGGITAEDDQQDDDYFACEDVVFIAGFADQKAAVEIIDEIGGAPIELRADCGHEGGQESGDHQAAESWRQEVAADHDVAFFGFGGEFGAGVEAAVG